MSITSLDEVQRIAKLSDAEVVALVSLPDKDLDDLRDPSLTRDDMLLIIRAKKEAEAPAEISGWDTFLKVMTAIVAVANVVIPVAGAVNSVLAVVSTAKKM